MVKFFFKVFHNGKQFDVNFCTMCKGASQKKSSTKIMWRKPALRFSQNKNV